MARERGRGIRATGSLCAWMGTKAGIGRSQISRRHRGSQKAALRRTATRGAKTGSGKDWSPVLWLLWFLWLSRLPLGGAAGGFPREVGGEVIRGASSLTISRFLSYDLQVGAGPLPTAGYDSLFTWPRRGSLQRGGFRRQFPGTLSALGLQHCKLAEPIRSPASEPLRCRIAAG